MQSCLVPLRSADKPKSQANWKAKYSLTYTLLSDPTYQVLEQAPASRQQM